MRFYIENFRWLSAGFLLTFTSCIGQTFFISLFSPQIRAEFGLGHSEWGFLYAAGTLTSAVIMLWAGTLVDRFRVRTLGAGILIALACSALILAGITEAWMVPIAIFLLRFTGQGMASHAAVVAMARWFVAARGKALAFASLGFSVGEALLPILVVAILVAVDWRALWTVAAVVAILGAIILWISLTKERSPQSQAQENQSLGLDNRHWTRLEVLRLPVFWAVALAVGGLSAFGTAFFFHHTVYAEAQGWSHARFVTLFPIYTLCAIGSMLVTGVALDRFGTDRMMPFYLLLTALGFLVMSQAGAFGMAVVGMALLGAGQGANSTLPNAFWAEFFGTQHIGGIKSIATSVMVLGSALGPWVSGYFLDIGVSLSTQFAWVSGYFVLVCLGIFATIRPLAQRLPRSAQV